MSGKRTTGSAGAATGIDAPFPSGPWECGTARFTAHSGPSVAVVTAHGEVDAANAVRLADYAQHCAAHSKCLILDLRGLEFFGTAGFSALHMINVRCAGANIQLAVVPSRAVSRLLRICDPDGALPMVESVAAVLAGQQDRRRLLQLVPQPR